MKIKSLILLSISLLFIFACDDGVKFDNPNDEKNKAAVQQGELGSECYPNKTCDEGLTCDKENNTCVEEPKNTNDDDETDTMSEYNEDKTDTALENDEDAPILDDSDSTNPTPDDTDSIDDSGDFVPDESDSDSTDTTPDNSDSTPDEDVVDETPDEVAVLECLNNCSGHGECDTTTGVCSCSDNHDGADCSECKIGYTNNGGTCVQKQCDTNKCFKTYTCSGEVLSFDISAYGTCSATGECMCDSGWKTVGSGATLTCGITNSLDPIETLYNVECTICDKNNPPSQYASSGCPQNLTEDTSLCNSILSFS
ncbi:hypothetical protein J5681_08900, partial [bacterium]|nr:hypothetical protein [bacterium]